MIKLKNRNIIVPKDNNLVLWQHQLIKFSIFFTIFAILVFVFLYYFTSPNFFYQFRIPFYSIFSTGAIILSTIFYSFGRYNSLGNKEIAEPLPLEGVNLYTVFFIIPYGIVYFFFKKFWIQNRTMFVTSFLTATIFLIPNYLANYYENQYIELDEDNKIAKRKKKSTIIITPFGIGLIIFSISANFSLLNSFTFIQRLI